MDSRSGELLGSVHNQRIAVLHDLQIGRGKSTRQGCGDRQMPGDSGDLGRADVGQIGLDEATAGVGQGLGGFVEALGRQIDIA